MSDHEEPAEEVLAAFKQACEQFLEQGAVLRRLLESDERARGESWVESLDEVSGIVRFEILRAAERHLKRSLAASEAEDAGEPARDDAEPVAAAVPEVRRPVIGIAAAELDLAMAKLRIPEAPGQSAKKAPAAGAILTGATLAGYNPGRISLPVETEDEPDPASLPDEPEVRAAPPLPRKDPAIVKVKPAEPKKGPRKKERRRFTRKKRRLKVRFRLPGDSGVHSGLTLDLSPAGLYIQARKRVSIGQPVVLEVELGGERTAKLQGEVVRRRLVSPKMLKVDTPGFAVRLIDAPPEWYQLFA